MFNIKNLILVFGILCFGAFNVLAQETSSGSDKQCPFSGDDNLFGIGAQFDGTYSDEHTSSTPYLSGYFEKCVKDNLLGGNGAIGIGALLGYRGITYKNTFEIPLSYPKEKISYGWKRNNITVGMRGILHYGFGSSFEAFGGLMLGYNVVSSNPTGKAQLAEAIGEAKAETLLKKEEKSSGIDWSTFVGARYYLGSSFAIVAEIGLPDISATIGLSVKF